LDDGDLEASMGEAVGIEATAGSRVNILAA
jgi:hypothetical protein